LRALAKGEIGCKKKDLVKVRANGYHRKGFLKRKGYGRNISKI